MTDQEQAEAVVDGLAEVKYLRCPKCAAVARASYWQHARSDAWKMICPHCGYWADIMFDREKLLDV